MGSRTCKTNVPSRRRPERSSNAESTMYVDFEGTDSRENEILTMNKSAFVAWHSV